MPKPMTYVSNPWRRCTARWPSGDFCDAPSLPDAPFPICLKHASNVLTYLRGKMEDLDVHLAWAAEAGGIAAAALPAKPLTRSQKSHAVLTYYVQVESVIKIGRTKNMTQRMFQYPPHARVLATEPGDHERERHDQFAHLLSGGREWFRAGSELLDFDR